MILVSRFFALIRAVLVAVVLWLLAFAPGFAATITTQTSQLGPTPNLLAYNSGHFYPGGNTAAWWRYAGVNGARIFIAPSTIEPADDLPPVGDGVDSETAFLARRAAMRTNQFNPAYINWPVFTNKYETQDLGGNNHIKVNFACASLRGLGVEVCAQLTASQSRFPISGTNDWPNLWELWQHYYAQAFYLGSRFEVRRYQMFNEPNHPNAGGLTRTNFLIRLQLASDAVQTALADVNRIYGKTLQPLMLAPVTAGSADGSYPGWGEIVMTNRHRDVLGRFDPSFSLVQVYDYHQYGSTPAAFGADLADLRSLLTQATAPEAPPWVAISEFNTRTGATYDTIPETLDYPAEYARFAAICVNLAANGCNELYAFKFALTDSDNPNYDVQKNAMHYVDNAHAPYNVGGINKAGEVWRLFNKANRAGRQRLFLLRDSAAAALDTEAVRDPASRTYYLFSVNNTAGAIPLTVNFQAWGIPATNQLTLEEVSEQCSGGIRYRGPAASGVFSQAQPAYSVWLMGIPASPQDPEVALPASDDAEARDGTFASQNFGGRQTITVRNDPASASNRSVALLKFNLPVTNLAGLQSAVLSLNAAGTVSDPVQAHVYALESTNWSQSTLSWASAPNLKDHQPPGAQIAQAIVEGVGASAQIAGQLVVTQTGFEETLLDVTPLIQSATNGQITFLISQDPRWDVTLPTLALGDIQPGGIIIKSLESSVLDAPKLRLVFAAQAAPPNRGIGVWTNAPLVCEAFVRGGAYAGTDPDEIATGYVMVKSGDASLDFSRKAYFQFSVPYPSFEVDTQAWFKVLFQASSKQLVQLWGLNQAYPGFSANLTWNTAQANETTSNFLKTQGSFTATPIGGPVWVPASGTEPFTFVIPRLGDFLQGTHVCVALTAQPDPASNDAGLRLLRTNATLQVLAYLPQPPEITATHFSPATGLTLSFSATPNQVYLLQSRTNVGLGPWHTIATNLAGPDGKWTYADTSVTNSQMKFYRASQN